MFVHKCPYMHTYVYLYLYTIIIVSIQKVSKNYQINSLQWWHDGHMPHSAVVQHSSMAATSKLRLPFRTLDDTRCWVQECLRLESPCGCQTLPVIARRRITRNLIKKGPPDAARGRCKHRRKGIRTLRLRPPEERMLVLLLIVVEPSHGFLSFYSTFACRSQW